MPKRKITDTPLLSVMRKRISQQLETHELKPATVSLKVGLGKEYLYDFLVGRKDALGVFALKRIADELRCTMSYLLGETREPFAQKAAVAGIPVVGTIEAGVFSELSGPEPWLGDSHQSTILRAPKSSVLSRARHFAMRVRGDSMNAALPQPFFEGEFALCVDIIDAGIDSVDGEICVVRRTSVGGGSFEWTIKRVRVFSRYVDLIPESTNPVHKTLRIPRRQDEDVAEVALVGVTYGKYGQVGRFA